MTDSTPATAAQRFHCPRCGWSTTYSEVDPHATADDILGHLKWLHGLTITEALEVIARV